LFGKMIRLVWHVPTHLGSVFWLSCFSLSLVMIAAIQILVIRQLEGMQAGGGFSHW
jgi:hypothetical protein